MRLGRKRLEVVVRSSKHQGGEEKRKREGIVADGEEVEGRKDKARKDGGSKGGMEGMEKREKGLWE